MKSGSAITGILESLNTCVAEADRADFEESVLRQIREAIKVANDYILIDVELAARLKSPLDELYNRLGAELGHPDPSDAPAMDETAGIDPVEAKWGKGKGWQYYCVHDLRLACVASFSSGEPICISFD